MPLDVAMPIIRRQNENYSAFYRNSDSVIQLLRQPRLVAGAANTSEGLSLNISNPDPGVNIETAQRLYAMFPGTLRFGTVNQPNGQIENVLVLKFLPPSDLNLDEGSNPLIEKPYDTLGWLYRLNRSCIQLKAVLYEGVNADKVCEALHHLVTDKWDDYRAFLSDPKLPDAVIRALVNAPGKETHINNIRELLNSNPGRAKDQLTQIIDEQFTQSPDLVFLEDLRLRVRWVEIPIKAGTWIGNMSDQMTLSFLGPSGSLFLNPLYFFRLLLKWRSPLDDGQRLVHFVEPYENGGLLTNNTPTQSEIHPLLWRLKNPGVAGEDYLRGLDQNIGDAESDRKYWLLFTPPSSSLSTVQNNTSLPNRQALVHYDPSRIPATARTEWRVDDYAFLVFRKRVDPQSNIPGKIPWEQEGYFTFASSTFQRAITTWNDWGRYIESAASTFHQPAEFFMGIIGKESGNVRRNTAFEPSGRVEDYTPGAGGRYWALTHIHYRPFYSSIVNSDGMTRLVWTSREAFKRALKDEITRSFDNFDFRTADYDYTQSVIKVDNETTVQRRERWQRLVIKNGLISSAVARVFPGQDDKRTWKTELLELQRKITQHMVTDADRDQFRTILADISNEWWSRRYQKVLPESLPDGDVINPKQDKFYTWGDLRTDLQVFNDVQAHPHLPKTLPTRISPGLMQTLLSVANNMSVKYPTEVGAVINVGRAAGDPLVIHYNDFWDIFVSLQSHPEYAIACGGALFLDIYKNNLRNHNVQIRRYDPLVLRACYAGGQDPGEFGLTGDWSITPGRPGENWAASYNAAVAYLNCNVQPGQTLVRLSTVTLPP